MKGESSKKKLDAGLTRQIESKLLITTTKYVNSLSKNIASRFDSLRQQQEEEFNKEYNLKFMSDRKRNKSNTKPLSSSKVSNREVKKEKAVIQPKRLEFQNQNEDFRKKYFDLSDYYLTEKKKWVQDAVKIKSFKETLSDFLYKQDSHSLDKLEKLEDSSLVEMLKRLSQDKKKWEEGDKILQQGMKILQVNSWTDFIQNLRARIKQFRNLDECTFKIFELQSINKKIIAEFNERSRKMRKQLEEHTQRELEQLKEEVELFNRSKISLQEQLEWQKKQYCNLVEDLQKLTRQQGEDMPKWSSDRNQILQIYKIINSLNGKLRDIQIEAQQNMIRLLNSNKQMMKLQRLMNELKDDMNQQLHEEQQKSEEYEIQINNLHQHIELMEKEIEVYKTEYSKCETERDRRNQEIEDEKQLLCSSLGLREANSAKVVIKIQENMKEIAQLRADIEDLSEAAKEKDSHIQSLTIQLDRSCKSVQQLKQTSKTALFQKDEYKFLLNNLRDQVVEMKKQNSEEKAKIIKQKDEEIIRSNKDILESYTILNDQHTKLKSQSSRLRTEFEENRAELIFLRKKTEHQEILINQKEQQYEKLMEQSERYRKYLKEIEASFKEVVNLQEISSKKVIELQNQKQQHNRWIKNIKNKNEQLQKLNNQLIQQRNELKMDLEKTAHDVKELRNERCQLQTMNVEIRLEIISKQSEITKLEEELKIQTKETKTTKQANQKLIGEINTITRKLIMVKSDYKKKLSDKLKRCVADISSLKKEQQSQKKKIISSFKEMRKFINDESEKVRLVSENIMYSQIRRQEQWRRQEEEHRPQKKEVNTISVDCQIDSQDKMVMLINLKEIADKLEEITHMKEMISEYVSTYATQTSQQLKIFSAKWLQILQSHHNEHDEEELSPKSPSILKSSKFQPLRQKISQAQLEQSGSSLEDKAQIMSQQDPVIDRYVEGQNVNAILQILIESQNDIPSVPYWQKIQTNFLYIRRRLSKKNVNLKLDISAIDCKDPSQYSPNSQSFFPTEGQFLRRFGTQPDEVLDPRDFRDPKQTNRSQKMSISQNDFLKRQNEDLKQKIISLVEDIRYYEAQKNEMQLQIQEMEIKLTSLQNETSIKGLEHNFKKLLEYLLAQNFELFEQTARIIMKMLHFANNEIKDYEEKLITKKKKKKTGLFGGLFKT